MDRLFKLLILLSILFSGPTRAGAEQNSCAPILVPVTLVAQDGTFLKHYDLSDLGLGPHSGKVRELSFEADTRLRRVVILLDVSGSMAGRSSTAPWKVVTDLLRHLGTLSNSRARLALLVFSDHIVESIDFSQDPDRVRRRIESISIDPEFKKKNVRGRTALIDALQAGFRLLTNPTSADSLIVITDGGENNSKVKPNELLKQLSPAGTRVFSILIEDQLEYRNRTVEEIQGPSFLSDFTEKTGGASFGPLLVDHGGHLTTTNSLRGYKLLSEGLLEFYKAILENGVLALEETTLSSKPVPLEVVLSKQGREKWKGARLLYPRQISACMAASANHD